MAKKNKHIGSDFDDFLKENGLLEKTEAVAVKRVIAYQIEQTMKKQRLNKSILAKRMHTSRSSIERLFDPNNRSVTLLTLERAAQVLGKELSIRLI